MAGNQQPTKHRSKTTKKTGATSSSKKKKKDGEQQQDEQRNDAVADNNENKEQEEDNENEEEEETLWQTFHRHPLVRVTPFVVIPYVLYYGYFWLLLQHPNHITAMTGGLIQTRPFLDITEPRQVLIIGTLSSGTVQIQHELKDQLGLEIGHETTDSYWYFVRDGTVSWFHGIRFLPAPTANILAKMQRSFGLICNGTDGTGFGGGVHANMGFHPASYRPPVNDCSYHASWSKCWARECYMTLIKEWGCAVRRQSSSSDNDEKQQQRPHVISDCEVPFRRTLHQVRNPLRTIESIVVKFCVGGLTGLVSDAFLAYATALFPYRSFDQDSCVEAAGYFVVEYQNAMIAAREGTTSKRAGRNTAAAAGVVIDDFYRIEEVSACDVAERAGFLDRDETLYQPNYERIKAICSDAKSPARQLIKQKENLVNKGQVQLGWDDLRGGRHGSIRDNNDRKLETAVKKLFHSLGYDASLEQDEIVRIEGAASAEEGATADATAKTNAGKESGTGGDASSTEF